MKRLRSRARILYSGCYFPESPKKVLFAVSTDANEFAHIDWIRTRVGGQSSVRLGIGDDAAAVRLPETTDCLVTVDMLMEGVHFMIPPATAQQIGRKTLAVNLSDIAAMAGRPRSAVVAVALNRHRGIDFACELHDGIQQLADEFDVAIAGGDTNVWDGPVVVSLTLLGEPTGDGPVRRSGARAGDWIMTTGRFGGPPSDISPPRRRSVEAERIGSAERHDRRQRRSGGRSVSHSR